MTSLPQTSPRQLSLRVSAALRETIVIACFALIASTATATEPPITEIAFAPDGKSVIAVSQVGVQVYSWPNIELERTLQTSSANLHCLAFSPNGKLLAIGGGDPSEEGLVDVFSWPEGKAVQTVSEHNDSVTSIRWLDNRRFFSASLDRNIHQCDTSENPAAQPSSPQRSRSIMVLKGHSRGVSGLSLLKDQSTLVSVGADQSVRVWNASTGELIRSLSQHTKPIHAVALRPAPGRLPMVASAAGDRTIRFWQPTIGRMVRYVRLEAEPLNIAWTQNGTRILAACVDGHVRVIDPVEVSVTHDVPAMDGWAYAIAVHPFDASVVVAGTNGRIRRIEID